MSSFSTKLVAQLTFVIQYTNGNKVSLSKKKILKMLEIGNQSGKVPL
jgi:hypothetical protein